MDMKTFKKFFKYVCYDCSEFYDLKKEYCEKCGSPTVILATKDDYAKYFEENPKITKSGLNVTQKVMIGLGVAGLILVILGITLSVLTIEEPFGSTIFPIALTLTIVGAILIGLAVAYIFSNSSGIADCCCLYQLSK
jgi:hypothetical protein